MNIRVLPDAEALAAAAAEIVVRAGADAVDERGSFTVGLSGGSTPRRLYQLLATAYNDQLNWERMAVYFADERCVGPEDEQSNYRMARDAMLGQAPIPPSQVHRMRGEIDAEEAAREYGQLLKSRLGEGGGLDLLLLGMGADGHTASLFPGTPALREQKHRCVANYVEKLRTWRLTLTYPFINRSGEVLVLVSGAEKAHVVSAALEGEQDLERLPIQGVAPISGKLHWLMDAPAAGME